VTGETGVQALVVGVRGMLGAELIEALRRDGAFGRVVAADLPETDITDERSLQRLFADLRPGVVFNCAAFTDVDACESQRDLAFAVNAEGAGCLARLAAACGAGLVHLSTDYVFDGEKGSPYVEGDPPAPLSAYGESKLEGERLVVAAGGLWTIIRTACLYGRGRSKFVDLMLRLARERDELSVVTDQVCSPTWTRDLAEALVLIARRKLPGMFHVVNAGACSRFEMVRFMLECMDLPVKVRPVESSAFPRPAAVPAYAALSAEKFQRETGHVMRPWQEALGEYVRERLAQ